MISRGDMFGVFALSSAICSHLLTRDHFTTDESWYQNKWFWAGFFGSLPALIAIIAHIFFSREKPETGAKK